jgi:hypothetical protein
MTRRLTIVLFLLAGFSAATIPSVRAQSRAVSPSTQRAAQAAAQEWLGLMAERDFEESWDEAAPLLRERIDRDAWRQRVKQLVDSIGVPSARTFTTVQVRDSLRQSAGRFVILRARATHDAGVFEEHLVLTPVEEEWRVAGYRVTPLRMSAPPVPTPAHRSDQS